MASTVPGRLASQLLSLAPSTDVLDVLLPEAIRAEVAAPACNPSRAQAAAFAKRGVKFAMLLTDSTDPEILRDLSKLASVTVRRRVAANPATPPDRLEYLATWALRSDDDETIDALLGTMRPSEYVPRVRGRRNTEDTSRSSGWLYYRSNALLTGRVVDCLERLGDPDEVWATFRLGIVILQRDIVVAAAAGRLPVDPAELMMSLPDPARASVVNALWGDRDVPLPDRAVDLTVDYIGQWKAAGEPEPGHDLAFPNVYVQQTTSAHALSQYAVDRFIRSGHEQLHECVARSVTDDKVELPDASLAELVEQNRSAQAATVLLSKIPTRLSCEQVAVLSDRATLPMSSRSVCRLLTQHPDLPEAAVVSLLQVGSRESTARWITGELPVKPTVSAVRLLATDPGSALADSTPSGFAGRQPTVSGSVADMVSVLAAAFTAEVIDRDSVRLALNEAGPSTLELAAPFQSVGSEAKTAPVARYVAARLTERFGADPAAWDVAVRTAGTLSVGTVDDWLAMVASLLPAPAPAADPPPADPPLAEPPASAAPAVEAPAVAPSEPVRLDVVEFAPTLF